MSLLSERAMLVSLHISSWSGMLIDREVTEEVHATNKAEKEAGRYNKRTVASRFLAGVSSAHSHARSVHKVRTLPWEDKGARALAAVGYIDYTTAMKDCRLRAEEEVKKFLQTRNEYMNEAKVRLGKMYDEADYPDDNELMEKFAFDFEVKSMPDVGDFRAKLSDGDTKAIIRDIERRTNERLEKAMMDVFLRIQERVQHMREKLHEYAPSKDGSRANSTIHSAIVQNIYDLANVLPTLNVTDDPRVEQLRKQMLEDLADNSVEILRFDPKVRADTISKADKLLKKVAQYMK